PSCGSLTWGGTPTCCRRCARPPKPCCARMRPASRRSPGAGSATRKAMAALESAILHGWRGAPLFRRLHRYALLMRMNRPIGIGLLLWPTLWALWIAARGLPDGGGMPPTKLLWVFIAGTIVMRAAGCVVNDFADRDIDPHVKRTRGRPLAQRLVSPHDE